MELALLLPVILVIVLAVAQVGLLWRSQILVTQAAREAARIGAVSSDITAIRDAARGATALNPEGIEVNIVERGKPGQLVTVRVRYRLTGQVPLIGHLVGERSVSAKATMLVES